MRIIHDGNNIRHDPKLFFRRGRSIVHPEQPSRYLMMRDAVVNAGHDLVAPHDNGLPPILAVHDDAYVTFLHEVWARRKELPDIDDEILTGHFARPHMHRVPDGLLGQLGFYTADTSTPIRAGTWDAVYGSAQTAISAANAALSVGHAYALCRPPGHHAYTNSAGGFCYLNNTAIAANHLGKALGGLVAVLDIDVHHGNGTQAIFYERRDILTVSVHVDPRDFFPFYAGYADELGDAEGVGFNHNLLLAPGAGDEPWLEAIMQGLDMIQACRPKALVVALGLDVSEYDPIGVLKVTRDGLERVADAIARVALPTTIIQEGGYLCEALPHNLIAFLGAFDKARI